MRTKMFLILLLSSGRVFAGPVDTTTAKIVATNFFVSRVSQSSQPSARSITAREFELELVHQEFDESMDQNNKANAEPYYYVYNVKGNNGYVIVAADDNVTPVLGYSFEGKYDTINQPPAFVEWMNNYKNQIKFIKSNKSNTFNKAKSEWVKSSSVRAIQDEPTLAEVTPMLSTTWDQGVYYNRFCPDDEDGPDGHVVVGCVAVAMAQIMNKWEYPNKCNDIAGYTDPINRDDNNNPILNSNYGWIPSIKSTSYNWSNMANNLSNATSDSKINAVAQLLYHCGVSVQMNYGKDASTAYPNDAAEAFTKDFNYSSSVQYVEEYNYSKNEWIDLLKNELNHNRPILYSGYRKDGEDVKYGHSFVCDGYQGTDYFHFNWGWSGDYDNYFYTNDLTPGKYSFNDIQNAVIGIQPPTSSTPSNDDCSDATLLISSTSNNYLENQTVNNATASGKPRASIDSFPGTPALADVWYSFEATATTHTINVDPDGSQLDAVIALYSSCSSDTELGSSDIIGGNGVFSYLSISGLTIGNYYYIRVYDFGGQTTDGGFNICVTGEDNVKGDDFYVQNQIVSSTTVEAGSTIDVSADQCYIGSSLDKDLGPVYLGYYLSRDPSFSSSSDTYLNDSPSSLGSDDPSNSESEEITIPKETTPGIYYILFVADYENSFDETDESNNVQYIQITVTGGGVFDDYYIQNESVYPDKLLATGLITIRCDLCYSGSSLDAEIDNCHLGYYFSIDKSFSSSSDTYIGSYITGMGSDDPIKNLSYKQASIPEGTSPGIYYILLVADYDDRFVETNENNNVKYVQITVVESSSSEDLYIQDFSISTSSVVAGETIDVTCIQCYIGSTLDANMRSSVVGYYLSTDTSFSSTEDIRLGTDGSSLGSDYPFESESATLTIPEGTTSGPYYVLFVVDYDNRFSESNENNNVSYVELEVSNITQIEKAQINKKIKVYPNPVSNELIIEYNENNIILNFELLDPLGRVIYNGDLLNKTIVNTSNLPSGIYFIRIKNNGIYDLRKIIKE